jgi:4-cresol dehydrogenase (hydroxylating)
MNLRVTAPIDQAIRAWRSLGAVLTDASTRARYQTATFATGQRVAAILRPRRAEQVAPILQIASRHRVPVHPISRGRSYGYGCRVPVPDGAVVLDLAGLRRISALSEELGHVTVEPGVTFRALAAYLRRRGSRRMVSVTASPEGSVLANALERGIGSGTLGDRVDTLCNLAVVLASGEELHTGFGRLPGARASRVHRWGVGPSLDGLFCQSSLGVVTSATIWLSRRPRYTAQIDLVVEEARLGKALAALRALLECGLHSGVIKMINEATAIVASHARAGLGDIDWARVPRPYPVTGPPRWRASLVLPGEDRRELRERCRAVVRRLAGAVDRLAVRAPRPSSRRRGPELGDPSDDALAGLYWRRRRPARPDPWRDGRGVIFCCPAVPFTEHHVRRAVGLLQRHLLAGAFDPCLTLNIMNERLVQIVAGLFYDRRAPGEDARAMTTYQALFAACLAHGYYPYRLGIQSAGQLPPSLDAGDAVLERIREALDPAGVLAGGRYRGSR